MSKLRGTNRGGMAIISSWSRVPVDAPFININMEYRVFWEAGSRIMELRGRLSSGAGDILQTAINVASPIPFGTLHSSAAIIPAITNGSVNTFAVINLNSTGVFQVAPDIVTPTGAETFDFDTTRLPVGLV